MKSRIRCLSGEGNRGHHTKMHVVLHRPLILVPDAYWRLRARQFRCEIGHVIHDKCICRSGCYPRRGSVVLHSPIPDPLPSAQSLNPDLANKKTHRNIFKKWRIFQTQKAPYKSPQKTINSPRISQQNTIEKHAHFAKPPVKPAAFPAGAGYPRMLLRIQVKKIKKPSPKRRPGQRCVPSL